MQPAEIERLNKLFRDFEVFDQESKWYYLNRLWYRTESRKVLYELFEKFWLEEVYAHYDALIVVPEGISSSFGILPMVSRIAHQQKSNFVIWKEFGDILTTEPFLFPEKEYLEKFRPVSNNCIVVQDVINMGTTLSKMSIQIHALGWRIQKYVGVVQFPEGESKLKNNLAEIANLLTDDFAICRMAFVLGENQLGVRTLETATIEP